LVKEKRNLYNEINKAEKNLEKNRKEKERIEKEKNNKNALIKIEREISRDENLIRENSKRIENINRVIEKTSLKDYSNPGGYDNLNALYD